MKVHIKNDKKSIQPSSEDSIKILALSLIEGFSPHTFQKVLEFIGGKLENLSSCDKNDLLQVVSPTIVDKVLSKAYIKPIQSYIKRLENLNVQYITLFDQRYPTLLNEIYDPPLVLYIKGDYDPHIFSRCISVVGTRNCTSYGKSITNRIVSDLVQAGFTIVSGMAFGIDSQAHLAAINGRGNTIAVLSGRVDQASPKTNHFLYEQIIKSNMVLSECPLDKEVQSYMFPIRNRIIAGLSLGTVVIEAPQKSGALITAHIALDEGREVFAVPSNVSHLQGEGTNRLIKQGKAKLIQSTQDIIEEFDFSIFRKEYTYSLERLDEEERKILEIVQMGYSTIDEVLKKTSFDISIVSKILSSLELKKYLIRNSTGTYAVIL